MGRRNRNALRDRITFVPQWVLLRSAAILPYSARLAFGGWIGRSAIALFPHLRRRIELNLRHVMPNLSESARSRIARGTGDSFGRTFIEILNNRAFHRHGGWIAPEGPGVAVLREAATNGTGAVLVSGHLGQWEAVRVWMRSQGINCAGVYRPTDNPHLNAIYLDNLEAGGTPIFAKGTRGIRGIVAHLSRGGLVAILTDQYEKRARRIDFLGKPAPTSFVAADLARKFNVPLIPAYGIREPDGRSVRLIVEAPIEAESSEAMMIRVNESLAARIRAHPAQYYWLHRRWEKSMARTGA